MSDTGPNTPPDEATETATEPAHEHGHLPPFQAADMPPKTKTFWQLVGPGAILVGLSIGSGELVMWPVITAKFGAAMVWAAAIGVFTQYWVNQELGRYTLATGESVYAGFARLSKFWAVLFIAINFCSWILPGWAVASGGALKAMLGGGGPSYVWTWITFAFVALALFGPKLVYQCVEKTIMALVAVVTVGLIIVAAKVAAPEHWMAIADGVGNILQFHPNGGGTGLLSLGRGMITVGYIDPNIPLSQFFAALVFAGAGGTSNIFINYYLRDKNLGMGARMAALVNPLRGESQKTPSTGYRMRETPENLLQWRRWFRHFRIDQAVFFWFLNTFTMFLFIVGALAVLHPRGLVPEGFEVAVTQSEILREVMGQPGRLLMLVVAFATLFSTQLALVDGVARSLSDILYVSFRWAQRIDLNVLYAIIAGGWILAGCALACFQFPPLLLLITSSCLGGLGMAVYCPLTLVINNRYLPPAIRPGKVSRGFMWWATGLYVAFSVFAIYQVVVRIAAG